MNVLLAFGLLFVFFFAVGRELPSREVGAIEKGFPAVGALRPGDELLAVDGKRGSVRALSERIASHRCRTGRCEGLPGDGAGHAAHRARRRAQDREAHAGLRPPYADHARGLAMPRGPREDLSVGAALDVTADQFWFITKATLELPARLIDPEQRKDISGVVSSYEVTRQTILDNSPT